MRSLDLTLAGTECAIAGALKTFFHVKRHSDALLDVLVRRKEKLSLRLFDFLCASYSKTTVCEYRLPNGKRFNVYDSYRNELRAHSKKNFDPFCRRERFTFETEGSTLETTLGQLNFFKWAIKNGVVEFASEHAEDIERSMNAASSARKRARAKRASKRPKVPDAPISRTLTFQ